MESTLLVQHYAGHIAGENNFQRIVLLQGDQFFGVESVPPEDVIYPHGLGRPEVPNHEAIVEELALEMHRLSLQTSDPGTGAEDFLIHVCNNFMNILHSLSNPHWIELVHVHIFWWRPSVCI
ncbi:Synaptotagmin-1 [Frankliniella fusca]|uniref:Synaptotagmin-1 n=1 Tax=Frankliniella fusca TaxID=407009 RepID=A0AAE1LQS1_9NEOP|nr:Synaptotagmin-1 [Frankliniella fusca]